MGYFYIAMTVLLTVFGQIVLKWQVGLLGPMPSEPAGKFHFIVSLLLRPWIIGGLVAAFAASLFWMASMTKFELSKAYPFMALNFVFVALIAVPLFGEALSAPKIIGIALVVAGLIALSQG
jgi:multidrug transporter EmrE-like cation transporter